MQGCGYRPREIAPGSSPSCRREKNAKAKTAWLKFSRSLSGKHFPTPTFERRNFCKAKRT
jgi:hypothetical protein